MGGLLAFFYKQATHAGGYQRTKMLKCWNTKTTNTKKRRGAHGVTRPTGNGLPGDGDALIKLKIFLAKSVPAKFSADAAGEGLTRLVGPGR